MQEPMRPLEPAGARCMQVPSTASRALSALDHGRGVGPSPTGSRCCTSSCHITRARDSAAVRSTEYICQSRSLHPPVSQHGQLIALPFTAQEAPPLQPSVAAASANLSSRANSLIAVVLRVGKMISQVPVRAPTRVHSQKAHRSSIRRSARPPTLRCLCRPPPAGLNLRDAALVRSAYRCTQLNGP
ncbi:hypothetical protein N5P37_001899 [Trichoderma harzianum]|nr:hypothetical protein N5P37_001899 [Trichoderma harzianum]